MASDPRERNLRHIATSQEPEKLDFAGPKQKEAYEYGACPLLLHGSYNSAKTVTFCLKILLICDLFPGYRWFIGRKVWDELRKTTMSSFFKFCTRRAWEPHGRRSDSEKILELNNGSSIIWGHLDQPDTLTIVRGLEINGFFLDQAEELEEEILTALLPRLGRWDRATVPDALVHQHIRSTGTPWPWIHPETGKLMPPSYALLTANPDHELHWMYPRFDETDPGHWEKRIAVEHDSPYCPNVRANLAGACKCGRQLADGSVARPGTKVSYHDLGYKMIDVNAYDNKYATRQSLQEMESQDEGWKHRFLWGKKGIPEGTIHKVRDESILEPTLAVRTYVQNQCSLHRVLDYGDSAPTCCGWFAVDREGNVFAYREYYEPNKRISEHRKNITELSIGEHYTFQLADPSIFYLTMQKHGGQWSVAHEYSDVIAMPRETAIFWQPADNNELGTRNRINEYLQPQGYIEADGTETPRPHPITKEMGLWPRLFFIKATEEYPHGCKNIITQTRVQRRVKIGTDNGRLLFSDERDPGIIDHGYDCALESTRYVYWENGWRIGTLGSGPKHGWVLTPYGPQAYSDLKCYKRKVPMLNVRFKNGVSVTTTPDHLFLTNAGWVEAESLTSSHLVFRFSMDAFIGKTVQAISCFSPGARGRSVERFIAMSIYSFTAKFLRDISSIIKTKIDRTMESIISNLWIEQSMPLTTTGDSLSRKPWKRYDQDLIDGRLPKPAENGLLTMLSGMLMENSTSELWNSSAFDVSGLLEARLPQFDVQNGAKLALLPCSLSAIENVEKGPSSDAWCLTVHHPCSSFLVEDGIAIHNCLRYFIASRAPTGRPAPVARSSRSFAAIRAEVKRAKAMERYRQSGRPLSG